MTLLAIIRVRGKTKVKDTINHSMDLLCLNRVNHCVLYKDSASIRGMIFKAKDYLTWGEVDKETVSKILKKRARLTANKRITDAWLKEHKLDWDKFVDLFMNDPKDAYKLGMSKVFRLTPPSKGFERKGIKTPYSVGGVLGNRKEKISILIEKMI